MNLLNCNLMVTAHKGNFEYKIKMAIILFYILPCCLFVRTISLPVEAPKTGPISVSELDVIYSEDLTDNLGTVPKNISKCAKEVLSTDDVHFLEKGMMFHIKYNITLKPTDLKTVVNGLHICFEPTDDLKKEILSKCEKWLYEKTEFGTFPNGSVVIHGVLQDPLTYDFTQDGRLRMCVVDYDYEDYIDDKPFPKPWNNADIASMYIGNIGSAISILALIAHIVTFCTVPSLRNLPGYNLLSFSVAFLMAYFFTLFGQIPQVLGLLCVVSGFLEYYFFLTAFFCMNVLAFDVWKTLRMAVEKLAVRTRTARKRQFLWYSLYAWLSPLAITISCVVAEYSEWFPDEYKPLFGRGDQCWMTNNMGKAVFFVIPAFLLFAVNAVFFVMSAYILKKNTIKQSEDESRQKVKMNFVLYVRVAIMMGVTWLSGVAAVLINDTVTWYISDLLTSLQGLFVFILFTCSRKVINYMKEKFSMANINTESNKSETNSTKFDSK